MCEYQQKTCTTVNMHSGKMDALTSGSGKNNVQHVPKSLCCCFTVVQGRGLERNCTRNILIEKMNPALKQEISAFCDPEHPKNMQFLDKIHTVFTAALTPKAKALKSTSPLNYVLVAPCHNYFSFKCLISLKRSGGFSTSLTCPIARHDSFVAKA